MPTTPQICAPIRLTHRPKSIGARKLVARPVVEYRPNSSPSVPGSARRARNVREADCAGPTNRQSSRPHTQNTGGSGKKSRGIATTIMLTSEITMMRLGPR